MILRHSSHNIIDATTTMIMTAFDMNSVACGSLTGAAIINFSGSCSLNHLAAAM
jgi:hypothetical protein